MTNKDTERLVQQAMQQTIPDKEALWEKIESDLPEQPVFGKIRRFPVRMQTIYRVMGAAACFLLIAGSLGVWQTLHFKFAKSENTLFFTADEPQHQERNVYENNDVYCEDMCGDAAYADDVVEAEPEQNNAYDERQTLTASQSEKCEAAAKATPKEETTMEITVRGSTLDICIRPEDLDAVAQSIPGRDAALQEMINVEAVRKNGVLVRFDHDGREIILTALDGSYRMTVDGQTFYATEEAADLLRMLEED